MFALRRKRGFPQRTYSVLKQTRYLPFDVGNKYWRSPVTQKYIKEDLFEFGNKTAMPDSFLLKCAINETRSAFKLAEPVKMLHLNDVFQQDLDIWNKSPGLPWRFQGFKEKKDIRDNYYAVKSVRKFWHLVKLGEDVRAPDSCAYVRSHLVQYPEVKVRAVWGYPATITFGEAVFAVPLIRAYQKQPLPIAYGFETALGGMMKIVYKFSSKFKFAFDFSKFDKTVPAWLINIAFSILADNVDFVHYQDHGVADADKNYRMFKYLKDYFINTPIRLASGERFIKNSGIASGSYFTQLIGSIVNYVIITWLCYENGIRPSQLLVLGDDSLLGVHAPLDMVECEQLISSIGMKLNSKKSCWSRNIHELTFLGYKINHGLPKKEFEDWLAALAFPEVPDMSFDDFASRTLGLFYANMGVDQTFDHLCRHILKRPFHLRLTRNMQRMLKYVGVFEVSTDLPDAFQFLQRLNIL